MVHAMDITHAQELVRGLMDVHGLTDWRLEFRNFTTTGGRCYYQQKSIALSKKLVPLWEAEAVKSTALHEIAHALVGVGHGHDAVWRAKLLSLGGDGKRTHSHAVVERWRLLCPSCGELGRRARRPARNRRYLCVTCREPIVIEQILSHA